MTLLQIFGTNLKYYRLKKGYSQEKLGELTGLHRTYISDLERFKRNISLDNLQKIAEQLQIEPYLLLVHQTQQPED